MPLVSCYKLDPIARVAQRLITTWSASLPNLIADRTVVNEFYNQYVRPAWLARHLEGLFEDTALRRWQKDGFAEVSRRLATERPAGEMAAAIILKRVANSE